jgi:hypothetical protein
MKALLWTLVVVAAINTLAVFWQAAIGKFEPMTMASRALDWIYTLGIGCWAMWILASK